MRKAPYEGMERRINPRAWIPPDRVACPQWSAHPLVEVITPELHRRIRYNAYAVGPVSTHEASPTLFSPHLRQALSHGQFIFFPADALDLEKDLQSLQRRYDRSRYGTGDTAGKKGGKEWMREGLPKLFHHRPGKGRWWWFR